MTNKVQTAQKPAGDIHIKQRDRTSLELKIRYLLKREHKTKNRYTIRLFFFFPHSFNINSENFGGGKFYNSLKLYMRFDTPQFEIDELLDEESDSSPLVRLENTLSNLEKKDATVSADDFIYENKLLGCVYKSLLRDSLAPVLQERAIKKGDKYLRDKVIKTAKGLYIVAERYHQLRKKADKVLTNPESLIKDCHLMDEHLSLLLERYLTSFLRSWNATDRKSNLDEIIEIIKTEARYRQKMGFATLLHAGSDRRQRQDYIYREKILKRYSSSVLFFDVRKSSKIRGTEHFLYALAAGLSMIFATAVVYLTQPVLGNLTTPLFIILVFSYMLKDRIKDIFRDLFGKLWGVRLFDRKIKLFDSRHHKKLAVLKERSGFIEGKRLDDELGQEINRETLEVLDAGLGTVRILCYLKRISIKTRVLRNIHHRINGLADISIIDFKDFLRYLARKTASVPVFSDKNTVQIVPVKRIYRLPVLIQVEEKERQESFGIQLIVDPKGIRSIEEGIYPMGKS